MKYSSVSSSLWIPWSYKRCNITLITMMISSNVDKILCVVNSNLQIKTKMFLLKFVSFAQYFLRNNNFQIITMCTFLYVTLIFFRIKIYKYIRLVSAITYHLYIFGWTHNKFHTFSKLFSEVHDIFFKIKASFN